MNQNNVQRWAVRLTALVSTGAFILSFDAQRKAAIDFGINPVLAWIVPLVIDLSIIVFSTVAVHAAVEKYEELKAYSKKWTTISIVTTLVFNASHAPELATIIKGNYYLLMLSQLVYAIAAPIFLAALVHALMVMMEQSTGETELDKKQKELEQLESELNILQNSFKQLEGANNQLATQLEDAQLGHAMWSRLSTQAQMFIADVLIHEEKTQAEFSRLFDIPATTLSSAKKVIQLEEVNNDD